MISPRGLSARFSDLGLRLASGLFLAVIGLVVVWLGGPLFVLAACVALALMLWEYLRMVTGEGNFRAPVLVQAALGGTVAVVLAAWGQVFPAMMVLVATALATGLLARRNFEWLSVGILYLGGSIGAAVVLRCLADQGFEVFLLVVMVVIAADVGAYFAGRSLGGPKLWRAVSPGKTWSGAVGGWIAAVILGLIFASFAGLSLGATFVVSLVVAIGSQCGDLGESAIKRRFGVKDSSNIIPGHGGVLDRFDGILGGIWAYVVLHSLGFGLIGQ